jgi:hypothetical protein
LARHARTVPRRASAPGPRVRALPLARNVMRALAPTSSLAPFKAPQATRRSNSRSRRFAPQAQMFLFRQADLHEGASSACNQARMQLSPLLW